MEEQKEQKGLQIEMDAQTAEGIYSNLAIVGHSKSEFIIDFVRVLPNMPKAKVKSRMIMSPEHAKGLMLALQKQISNYEHRFGEINMGGGELEENNKTVPFPISFGSGEA